MRVFHRPRHWELEILREIQPPGGSVAMRVISRMTDSVNVAVLVAAST